MNNKNSLNTCAHNDKVEHINANAKLTKKAAGVRRDFLARHEICFWKMGKHLPPENVYRDGYCGGEVKGIEYFSAE